MNIIARIFKSSLGKKYLMAVTGFLLVLFVIGHMVGNLQVFLGPEAINRYGHFLQSNVELLWPVRVAMLAFIGLHIWAATKLSLENSAARPIPYGVYQPLGSTFASRHMLMGGLIVAVFVIYHILHYTVQVKFINLTGYNFVEFHDSEMRHDIFRMIVVGFSNPLVSAFYLLGVGFLCLHLSHGISSMFQSLGWRNDTYRPCLDRLSVAVSVILFLGYSSIPVAVLCGYGRAALNLKPGL